MSPEDLVRSLLGDRRASEYIFSLPSGEFEEHLEAYGIPKLVVDSDDTEIYRLAGMGYFPVVYLEYGVSFETDVPETDVLHCLDHARQSRIPPPRMVVGFSSAEQCMLLRTAIRFMCLARREPIVKRIAPKRARVVYECRAGERWVEIYLSKQPIPEIQRLSA